MIKASVSTTQLNSTNTTILRYNALQKNTCTVNMFSICKNIVVHTNNELFVKKV